jgi:tetratricopeptide (TPR) repeat protein
MPRTLRFAGFVAVCVAALPSLARAGDADGGRKYALLVGVSEYRASAELRALPGADNDVTRLREVFLGGGFRPEDVTLLTCRGGAAAKPTQVNIQAALQDLTARCKPEDTLVLAFAGHGIQFRGGSERYFCPFDAVWNKPDTLVPLLRVFEQIGRCQARRKLLLVDACRNDPLAETRGQEGNKKAIVKEFSLSVPEAGDFVALLSCDKGQSSWEDSRLRHGVFFHYVIMGLAGEAAERDGTVTLDGLVKYVRQNVKDHVKKEFDAEQSPIRLGQDSPFAILQLASATAVQKLMREAFVATSKGDLKTARRAYSRALEIDKKNNEAYYQRGMLARREARDANKDAALRAAKYEEAARDFDRALRSKPDMVAAYVARADVNYRQDNLQAAIRDYDAALEMDDQAVDVLTDRGFAYYWLKKPDQALADAAQALEMNPDYPMAYYVRGTIRIGSQQDEGGLADIDRAIALDPHNIAYRDSRVKPDALLTGKVKVSDDLARLTVTVEAMLAGAPGTLRTVTTFEVKTDRDLLRELGQSYAVTRDLAKTRAERDRQAVADARRRDLTPSGDLTPDNIAGIRFRVLYDGLPQAIRPDERSPGEWRVDPPRQGQRVALELGHNGQLNERLGVTLRVNGRSVWAQSTGPDNDPDTGIWVYEPGRLAFAFEGFVMSIKGENLLPFRVLSEEESAGREAEFGEKCGLFDVDVFASRPGGSPDGEVLSISRGMTRSAGTPAPPKTNNELRDRLLAKNPLLKKLLSAPRRGGLVVGDDKLVSGPEVPLTSLPDWQRIGRLSIRYYDPKGSGALQVSK